MIPAANRPKSPPSSRVPLDSGTSLGLSISRSTPRVRSPLNLFGNVVSFSPVHLSLCDPFNLVVRHPGVVVPEYLRSGSRQNARTLYVAEFDPVAIERIFLTWTQDMLPPGPILLSLPWHWRCLRCMSSGVEHESTTIPLYRILPVQRGSDQVAQISHLLLRQRRLVERDQFLLIHYTVLVVPPWPSPAGMCSASFARICSYNPSCSRQNHSPSPSYHAGKSPACSSAPPVSRARWIVPPLCALTRVAITYLGTGIQCRHWSCGPR